MERSGLEVREVRGMCTWKYMMGRTSGMGGGGAGYCGIYLEGLGNVQFSKPVLCDWRERGWTVGFLYESDNQKSL